MAAKIATFVAILSICGTAVSGQQSWWSLGVTNCPGGVCARSFCDTLGSAKILTASQINNCIEDVQAVKAIASGARHAIIVCQNQFVDRKWTCRAVNETGTDNLFGSFISEHRTRETGVLFAFFVAGALQQIAQHCREGKIIHCKCFTTVKRYQDDDNNLIFVDCPENITWASEYLQTFIRAGYTDLGNTSDSIGAIVDFHNIDVGQKAVSVSKTECLCHGISGSCTVQTCYEKIPSVYEIGEDIYSKYDGAVKVDLVNGELQSVFAAADRLEADKLTYIDNSPNLCVLESKMGVLGTAHRECDNRPDTVNNCAVLCCDRGYYTSTEVRTDEECKFVFCCKFVCVDRNTTLTVHRCNA